MSPGGWFASAGGSLPRKLRYQSFKRNQIWASQKKGYACLIRHENVLSISQQKITFAEVP